jgi:hypothetical protein
MLLRNLRRLNSLTTTASPSPLAPSLVPPTIPVTNPLIPETPKKSRKPWFMVSMFMVFNITPFIAGYFYLKQLAEEHEKKRMSLEDSYKGTTEEFLNHLQRSCSAASTVLSFPEMTVVYPHAPEEADLEFLPKIKDYYDPLVDVISAQYSKSNQRKFKNIFLSVSTAKESIMTHSLIYVNGEEIVTVHGEMEKIDDDLRLKDYYWKNRWGIKRENDLLKFKPTQIKAKTNNGLSRGVELTQGKWL